jgi:hypothetical protein
MLDPARSHPRVEAQPGVGRAEPDGRVSEDERGAWHLALLAAELRGIENGLISAARLT